VSSTRVIIADDDALARRAIRDALQSAGLIVIGETANGRDTRELAAFYKPEVVLIDVDLPPVSALDVIGVLHRDHPKIKILVLGPDGDDDVAFGALRKGACGYVARSLPPERLYRAVEAVAAGEAVITRQLTMALLRRFRQTRADGAGLRPVRSPLSRREWEVLDCLCEGMSSDEIATHLALSRETVRTHVKNVLRKLEVRSRREAVKVTQQMRASLVASAAPPARQAAGGKR
jgi:DNA-binding NarL/FixJ family response regulator